MVQLTGPGCRTWVPCPLRQPNTVDALRAAPPGAKMKHRQSCLAQGIEPRTSSLQTRFTGVRMRRIPWFAQVAKPRAVLDRCRAGSMVMPWSAAWLPDEEMQNRDVASPAGDCNRRALAGVGRCHQPRYLLLMATVYFLDGKQHGKTTTVDDGAISSEGRYRFKKREFTKKGGRTYYLKAVPKKRWANKKVPEWTAALDDDRAD